MSNNIPIFLACDDNYAPFLCTTIYSILEHTTSFIDFYVMDGGISQNNKIMIKNNLKSFKNYTIKYFNMSTFDVSKFPNVKHYSLNTFFRYFIPQLVPNLKKVLYLDVDIIVKKDIAFLYNQNLERYPLGAVLEDFYPNNYQNLKHKIYPQYKGGEHYFNAGVLLIDVQKFIKNSYSEKCVDLTIKLYDKLCCPDQDVLNIIFENNFKILDYEFNYMPDHFYLLKQKHSDISQIEPTIIHYTGIKPWKKKCSMQIDFQNTLKKTSYYKIFESIFNPITQKKYYLFGFIPLFSKDQINE